MPRSLSQKQKRRWITALLIAVSAVVGVWRVAVQVSAQTSVIFSDDFNSSTRDTAKWKLGVLNLPPEAYNPNVTVTQGPRLSIKPVANTATWSHNGYVSVPTYNLTGTRASVDVQQVASGAAYTIFAVGTDSDNWYRIVEHSGQLDFQDTVAGVKNTVSITYNATQHRYWRIQH